MSTRRPSGLAVRLAAALTLAGSAPGDARGQADTSAPLISPEPRKIAELAAPTHPAVAPSPDGRFLAALQTRPDPVLWIVPTDGAEPFAYRKYWAAYSPRWAPSGQRVGFIAAIGPPRIWTVELDPESGRAMDPPRLLIRTPANAFAIAPDGGRIALIPSRSTAAGTSEIRIIDWESRNSRTLLREVGMVYWVDWAPDGESLYYGVSPNDVGTDPTHRIIRASVKNGRKTTVLHASEFLGLSPDGKYLIVRPADLDPDPANVLLVAETGGAAIARVQLPADMRVVRWAADSRTLLGVRAIDGGTSFWAAPLCPVPNSEAGGRPPPLCLDP